MKISNSKKELARIIIENGGWPERALWAVQDNCIAFFLGGKPEYKSGDRCWYSNCLDGACVGTITRDEKVTNWHQTVLSRDEYFHLYPAPEPAADTAPTTAVDAKPTIEQLAADYRNAKDYAECKQQEADDANADADAKLKALELAGEAIGLIVSPITENKEPELVIAVQAGDEVECIKSNINPGKYMGRIGTVSSVDVDDTSTPYLVDFSGEAKIWCHEVKFIRRP